MNGDVDRKRGSDYQYGYSEQHGQAMYDDTLRSQKADKTLSVVRDHAAQQDRSLSELTLLEVGCSTGFTASACSGHFARVVGIDIDAGAIEHARRNFAVPNLTFQVEDSLQMSFPDACFDAVTCSQIYEHVPDPVRLLSEIHRVLRPGGFCYFAAGNRLVLMEPHYRLPLLSVLPKALGHVYVRLAGKADHYYESHRFLSGLKTLVRDFEVVDYTRRIIEDPVKFNATDMLQPGSLKQRVSLAILDVAYWLCPTYVWILVKP